MRNLRERLQKRLDKAGRILLLGVGSELRGDDAAGMVLAQNLKRSLRGRKDRRVRILLGGTAPENLTGQIKRFNPSHLVILDAADMGKRPGETAILETKDLDNLSFGTHVLSLGILVNYLLETLKMDVFLLGIQPESLEINQPLSLEVGASVNKLSALLAEIL
ncbi:MAG: hydrogenase maturation peptidase HycI [bacterium]